MTFEEYIAIDRVNWSTLKSILKSPRHYQHALATPRKDTPALAMGRAVHCAVLEPDELLLRYAVRPDGIDRRTKAGKEEWAAFVAANEGKDVLDADDYRRALAIRDAVRSHPVAAGLVTGAGENEQSIVWTRDGIDCKGRLDRVTPSAIVDLKTARDIDARAFGRTAAAYAYHAQLAWYQDGWERVTGSRLPCVIVAVESDAPHDVAVIDVDDDALEAGREDVARALAVLSECRASGEWPGRYPARVGLQLPAYLFADEGADDIGLDFSGYNSALEDQNGRT